MPVSRIGFSFIASLALFVAFSVAHADGTAADLMCDPYFVECPCNQVPNPNKQSQQKCIPGTSKNAQGYSNTHACTTGVCVDTTNKEKTSGICTAAKKCLATKTAEGTAPTLPTEGDIKNSLIGGGTADQQGTSNPGDPTFGNALQPTSDNALENSQVTQNVSLSQQSIGAWIFNPELLNNTPQSFSQDSSADRMNNFFKTAGFSEPTVVQVSQSNTPIAPEFLSGNPFAQTAYELKPGDTFQGENSVSVHPTTEQGSGYQPSTFIKGDASIAPSCDIGCQINNVWQKVVTTVRSVGDALFGGPEGSGENGLLSPSSADAANAGTCPNYNCWGIRGGGPYNGFSSGEDAAAGYLSRWEKYVESGKNTIEKFANTWVEPSNGLTNRETFDRYVNYVKTATGIGNGQLEPGNTEQAIAMMRAQAFVERGVTQLPMSDQQIQTAVNRVFGPQTLSYGFTMTSQDLDWAQPTGPGSQMEALGGNAQNGNRVAFDWEPSFTGWPAGSVETVAIPPASPDVSAAFANITAPPNGPLPEISGPFAAFSQETQANRDLAEGTSPRESVLARSLQPVQEPVDFGQNAALQQQQNNFDIAQQVPTLEPTAVNFEQIPGVNDSITSADVQALINNSPSNGSIPSQDDPDSYDSGPAEEQPSTYKWQAPLVLSYGENEGLAFSPPGYKYDDLVGGSYPAGSVTSEPLAPVFNWDPILNAGSGYPMDELKASPVDWSAITASDVNALIAASPSNEFIASQDDPSTFDNEPSPSVVVDYGLGTPKLLIPALTGPDQLLTADMWDQAPPPEAIVSTDSQEPIKVAQSQEQVQENVAPPIVQEVSQTTEMPMPPTRPTEAEMLAEALKPCGGQCERGDSGANIKNVQNFLNSMGAKINEDGLYGPKTEAAVRAFQAAQGIRADGIIGAQTIAKMESIATPNFQSTQGDYFTTPPEALAQVQSAIPVAVWQPNAPPVIPAEAYDFSYPTATQPNQPPIIPAEAYDFSYNSFLDSLASDGDLFGPSAADMERFNAENSTKSTNESIAEYQALADAFGSDAPAFQPKDYSEFDNREQALLEDAAFMQAVDACNDGNSDACDRVMDTEEKADERLFQLDVTECDKGNSAACQRVKEADTDIESEPVAPVEKPAEKTTIKATTLSPQESATKALSSLKATVSSALKDYNLTQGELNSIKSRMNAAISQPALTAEERGQLREGLNYFKSNSLEQMNSGLGTAQMMGINVIARATGNINTALQRLGKK